MPVRRIKRSSHVDIYYLEGDCVWIDAKKARGINSMWKILIIYNIDNIWSDSPLSYSVKWPTIVQPTNFPAV